MVRSKGLGSRRAIILGAGPEARRVYSALVRSPKFGVDPVAFVDDGLQHGAAEIYEPSYHPRHSASVISGPLCPDLFHRLRASVLVIATSALERETLLLTIAKASEAGVSTYFAPGDLPGLGGLVEYSELDGILLAHHTHDVSRMVYRFGKRLLDVVVASIGLAVLAVLAPFVAIAITLTSAGPVLFRQQRVGETGHRFTMYKFRTMYREAPAYSHSPGAGDDPRVTPVGRFLRHTSIDELPQLINVLLGHMSLVGPRPEMPFIVEQYTPVQRLRLTVKPGITGLWQISPARAFPIIENLEYDFYLIDDCVEGLLRLMASNYREPLNLGTEEMVSVDQLVDMVCDVAGKKLTKRHELNRPQGVRGRNSDNSRLRAVLGWEPKTPLREGLKTTYRWIEDELRRTGRLAEPELAYASD